MAAGCPVVAAEIGQLGRILSAETAMLVKPGDRAAFATAIERLLDDPVLAARLGEAARTMTAARYSWHANVSAVMEVITNAARGRRLSRPVRSASRNIAESDHGRTQR
jgi:glycosyltransferase involved in cell wall biosynthesis